MVQEIYRRFLAGEAMVSIARWTQQMGMLTHRGNPWTAEAFGTFFPTRFTWESCVGMGRENKKAGRCWYRESIRR